MSRILKAIIVDDERLARSRLRSMLMEHPNIQIVAEADSVRTALTAIKSTQPDVLFLDIQMPGETGFDLVNQLQQSLKIVFTTAFDEYAIRAFEVNALDYLLKPVSPERLALAIDKLQRSEPGSPRERRPLEHDDFMFLTVGETSRFLRVNEIRCIVAAGVYSEVITSEKHKFLILRALTEWEERLPQRYFARIHRSTIINIEFVERIDKWSNYSYQIRLRGIAEPLTMSRRYAARLREKLG